MTEVYRFFDVVQYAEADQAEVQTRFRRDGLIYEAANRLAISAPGGMFVRIATGEMMIQGFWYKNDSDLDLAIAANSSGFTRIDRIVLHLDRNGNSAHIIVLTGTPGGSPSAPNVTQNPGGSWEISLGTISIATGTLAVTGGMITSSIPVSLAVTNALELGAGVVDNSALATGAINNSNKFGTGVVDTAAIAVNAATKGATTVNVGGSSTTSTSMVLLATVTITAPFNEDVFVRMAMSVRSTGNNVGMDFQFLIDGTPNNIPGTDQGPADANYRHNVAAEMKFSVNAGSHTFALYWKCTAGTMTCDAGHFNVDERRR